jgi:GntR family transcriptional regulator / MocR family aminotransferase
MDLLIQLDRSAPLSLHQQLYEAIRQAILEGQLLPGQRLPSTRSLAHSLSVSRTTVTQSYEQLLSQGYLETMHGSGTYVCAQLPDFLGRSGPVNTAPPERSPVSLSPYGTRLQQTALIQQPEPATPISFRYGRPALDRFPLKLWRQLLVRHSRRSDWLDYASDLQGYLPLRQAIARYLARVRAVRCDPAQIVMTNGTQQAIALVLRLLIQPGDGIALEEPGYLSARRIFLSHGAALLPIPVDASGLVVEKLVATADATVRLVYVTPSHQFPTGSILSLARRLELLDWVQQSGAMILEDDYDSEYRYGDRPIPALQGLASSESVIYCGTFSKVLFPSLRLGYLVLPCSLVPLVTQAKWLSDRQLPLLDQMVLADFIAAGHLESHIRKMRSHYDHNRQTLVQALTQQFGQQVEVLGEQAGIHVMVRFHLPFSHDEILDRITQAGVGVMSAQPHYCQPNDRSEFIFGYGELTPAQIQEGIAGIAQALDAAHIDSLHKLS